MLGVGITRNPKKSASQSSSTGKAGSSLGDKSGSEESLYVYRGSVASEYEVPLAFLRSRSQNNDQNLDEFFHDGGELTNELMSSREGRAALEEGRPLSRESRRKLRNEPTAATTTTTTAGKDDAEITKTNQPTHGDTSQSKKQTTAGRLPNEQQKTTGQKGRGKEEGSDQETAAVNVLEQVGVGSKGTVAQILVNGQPPQNETAESHEKTRKGKLTLY